MSFKQRLLLKLFDWIAGMPPTKIKVGKDNDKARKDWVIRKLKNIPDGSKILDAGAGELFFKPYCAHLEYLSQDFNKFSPSETQKGMQPKSWAYGAIDIASDITQIPCADASFDVILCSEVLEHVPYPVQVIQELSRLLRPDGILLLTTPFNSYVHFAPYHFTSGFSPYFYEYHLPKCHLKINELTPNGNLFEHLGQNLLLLQQHYPKYVQGIEISPMQKRHFLFVLKALELFSEKDASSFETDCYGWMVEAQKIPERKT